MDAETRRSENRYVIWYTQYDAHEVGFNKQSCTDDERYVL
jgi:hypothetical protein